MVYNYCVLRSFKLLQYYLLPCGSTLCVQFERTYRVYEPVSDQDKEELKCLESKRRRRFCIAFGPLQNNFTYHLNISEVSRYTPSTQHSSKLIRYKPSDTRSKHKCPYSTLRCMKVARRFHVRCRAMFHRGGHRKIPAMICR